MHSSVIRERISHVEGTSNGSSGAGGSRASPPVLPSTLGGGAWTAHTRESVTSHQSLASVGENKPSSASVWSECVRKRTQTEKQLARVRLSLLISGESQRRSYKTAPHFERCAVLDHVCQRRRFVFTSTGFASVDMFHTASRLRRIRAKRDIGPNSSLLHFSIPGLLKRRHGFLSPEATIGARNYISAALAESWSLAEGREKLGT